MNNNGSFTISLDFELFWGVRDVKTLESYEENIRNVHVAIPKILQLFEKYQIHATWAVVGFLFFKDKKELLENLPSEKPVYEDTNLDQYTHIEQDPLDEKYHFAPGSIALIKSTPYQEIGTHTFCHYYTLEKGQTLNQFQIDTEAAIKTQSSIGRECKSIIFPRNQYTDEYLKLVKQLGIDFYRGNEDYWLYKPREYRHETIWIRMIRLMDAYLNISGHNSFKVLPPQPGLPTNVPASRFLRPYSSLLAFMDWLRFRRISTAMTYAAKNKQGYHLWWHPHNFGKNIQKNLDFLERILKHYHKLNKQYGFISKAMNEY